MPEDLKAEIEEYCPKTLPEVKAKIADQETILKSKAPVSETEIQNMRNLKEEKVKAEKELKDLGEKFESLTEELKRDEVDLVNGIKDMCESINEKFCELMADMGYAGEVCLHKGDEDLDFKHYGLKIMVKFRDSESLQPLSGSVQSGGEKSVTTALYIMALQEMTEVPFRCVDEINQGMDEHNEKRIVSHPDCDAGDCFLKSTV